MESAALAKICAGEEGGIHIEITANDESHGALVLDNTKVAEEGPVGGV